MSSKNKKVNIVSQDIWNNSSLCQKIPENKPFIVNDDIIGQFEAIVFNGGFMPFRSRTGFLKDPLFMVMIMEKEKKMISLENVLIGIFQEEMDSRLMTPAEFAETDFIQRFMTDRPMMGVNFNILCAVDDYFFQDHGPYRLSAYNYAKKGNILQVNNRVCTCAPGKHNCKANIDRANSSKEAIVSQSYFFTMKTVNLQQDKSNLFKRLETLRQQYLERLEQHRKEFSDMPDLVSD